MSSFRQGLIEQTIKYFQKRCGLQITYEQAERNPNSLADLYESLIAFSEFDRAPDRRLSAGWGSADVTKIEHEKKS